LRSTEQWFDFGPDDVWTLFHSYAFDFTVWELWGSLLYGGRLVVVPYLTSRSPEDFLQLLADARVTVLTQTPSAFSQPMAADRANPGSDLALRYVIFGGEALELGRLDDWYSRHPEDAPTLVNMYGITETTVHVSYVALDRAYAATAPGSVIGVGIPDLKVYVLDDRLQPVPPGVVGGGRGPGGRLSDRAGPAGRRVRRRPARRPGRPHVPHRRPRPLARRRDARVPGPRRPAGAAARVPHRARRDRGRAGAARVGLRRRRRRPRRPPRRLRGRGRRGLRRAAPLRRPGTARAHGPGRGRGAGRAP